jgi:plastocyanin
MKTIVIGILVVVIGAVVAYIVWPQLASAPGTDAKKSGEDTNTIPDYYDALISYTEEGYSPSSVTIKKGQSVRWTNDATSDVETWPASAVHPTHSIYPVSSDSDCLGSSFDACRGLKQGGVWQFTFNEVGEWRFHDHLHPSKTGVVIVTE